MPIDEINDKSHKTERQQKLFNQSYKVKITPLVIYGLGGMHRHTDTHTHVHDRIKVITGAHKPARAWFNFHIALVGRVILGMHSTTEKASNLHT